MIFPSWKWRIWMIKMGVENGVIIIILIIGFLLIITQLRQIIKLLEDKKK